MHKCYVPHCNKQVPDNQGMCKPHWFRVPKPLRDEIFRSYREKDGTNGARWLEAIKIVDAEVTGVLEAAE